MHVLHVGDVIFTFQSSPIFFCCNMLYQFLPLEIPKFMIRSSERSFFLFENTWNAFLQVEVLDMEELGMEVAR